MMSLRAVKEVRETPMGQEIITSAENVSLPQPPTPMPPKTGDDHMADLQAWLKDRGLTMMIVAIGNRSGIPCSAKDWEPDTHRFTVMLVENNGANSQS